LPLTLTLTLSPFWRGESRCPARACGERRGRGISPSPRLRGEGAGRRMRGCSRRAISSMTTPAPAFYQITRSNALLNVSKTVRPPETGGRTGSG